MLRLAQPAAISGTVTTPWRVVMIANGLNALVNNDMVHNLCPPPDRKLFPKGIKTEWIQPGAARMEVSRWRRGRYAGNHEGIFPAGSGAWF